MYHFLNIDDVELNRFVLSRMLQKIYPDCCIIEASTGKEALDKFELAKHQNINFDIIFCDYSMPPFNGDKVIEKLRLYYKYSGKIIVVTAYSKTDMPKMLCDDLIEKPIIFGTFSKTIKEIINE